MCHCLGQCIQLSNLQQSTKFATLISNKVCVTTLVDVSNSVVCNKVPNSLHLFPTKFVPLHFCPRLFYLQNFASKHILFIYYTFLAVSYVTGSSRRLIIVTVMTIRPTHRERSCNCSRLLEETFKKNNLWVIHPRCVRCIQISSKVSQVKTQLVL